MKKTLLLILLVACRLLFVPAYSQNSIKVKEFDRLNLQGNIEALLEQGASEEVLIEEGQADAVSKIDLEIEGKTLKIKMNLGEQVRGEQIRLRIFFKNMKEVKATGGAEVNLYLPGENMDFSAHVQTGANLNLEGHFSNLELSSATGGKVKVRGSADYLEAAVNTTGEIRAGRLEVTKALLKAHTGGVLEATVSKSVEASVATAAEIILAGNPEEEKISTSVGGKITRVRSVR
ncbi:MAG: GIN domain-containing protein [Bacteroidales bacterium]